MFDLIAIGDIKLDTFVMLDKASVSCQLKMPECQLCLDYGAKIAVNVVDSQIAGTAPNVAVGLARMHLKTAVMSNMGTDGTRHLALKRLTEEKVSTKFIRAVKGIPSAYSVVLNFQGERTVLTSHPKHKYTFPKPFPKTKWIYVGEMGASYETLFKNVTNYVKKNNVKLALNPGSIQIEAKRKELFELIKQSHLLFVNLQEAQQLSGETSTEIHRIATALWELNKTEVVITDGRNGSYHFDGKALTYCPLVKSKVVGTIGAGDAFATGYLGTMIKKLNIHPLLAGSINAASVVTDVGPQNGLLSDMEILKRAKTKTRIKPKRI